MIQKKFDDIDKSDIELLIENSVPESKTLEYKQELPKKSDRDRKEFLKDVSSFANASGGDLIFGIKDGVDQSGIKSDVEDFILPIENVAADDAIQWCENIIRDSLSPRILLQTKAITGWGTDGKGFVLLLRITNSFSSPHMVTFQGGSRFYSRNSAGAYQLDIGELRTEFLATDSQAERITRFRQDRLGKIIADETPVALSSPQRLVLHMIPLASFLNNERVNLSQSSYASFPPIGGFSSGHRYNLDGRLTYAQNIAGQNECGVYCQFFFNGAIEAVQADIIHNESGERLNGEPGIIASVAYERELVSVITEYLKGYKEVGMLPPVVISLALLGCKGSTLAVSPMKKLRNGPHPIDRDYAVLPDVVIENLDADVSKEMKPIFDAVWNACGYPHSSNYDDNGNWNPQR